MKQRKQARPARALDTRTLAQASGGYTEPQPWFIGTQPQPWFRALDPDPQPW